MKPLRLLTVCGAVLAAIPPWVAPGKPLPRARKEAAATADGCVWKVTGPAGAAYLAGSVHLLREKDHPLPETYDLAYADCAEVVFEVDMAEMTGPVGIAKMNRLGTFPKGQRLKDYLSEKTYARLLDYCSSRGLPVARMDRLRPGTMFLTISAIEATRLKADAELGLETVLYRRSVVDGKPSRGLETIEYQLGRFDELTGAELDSLIFETLDRIDELAETIDRILETWRRGDVEALDRLLNEQMGEQDRIRELLLLERNRNWVPEIEKAIAGKKGHVLFVVGAAHLVGKDSVIDLLKKKGYRIERVLSPAGGAVGRKAA
ncbi:MAG: TraB/GumN family protein [Verrucomicrobiae bacterium]|nr:TraB/GumN family protein [Verrucomicrobiae bacterium]MCP5551524.1 TraB/GumN family protein [Akkermansiaceae bacterium]